MTDCVSSNNPLRTPGETTGRRNRPTAWPWQIAVVLIAIVGPACSQSDSGSGKSNNSRPKAITSRSGKTPTNARMVPASSKEFGNGYADGSRDAQRSVTDMGPAWMWLWTRKPDYRNGYDRGWQDGRTMKKMKQTQREQAPALSQRVRGSKKSEE